MPTATPVSVPCRVRYDGESSTVWYLRRTSESRLVWTRERDGAETFRDEFRARKEINQAGFDLTPFRVTFEAIEPEIPHKTRVVFNPDPSGVRARLPWIARAAVPGDEDAEEAGNIIAAFRTREDAERFAMGKRAAGISVVVVGDRSAFG